MLRERAADLIAWLRRRCSPPRQAPPEPRNLPKSSEAAGDGDASAARSRHFAHVAHELRTPLNAILGFSEMIRCEAFGPVGDPHYAEYAGLIHQGGDNLLKIINQIMDLTKISAGRYDLRRTAVDAGGVLWLARETFQSRAAVRGIEIDADRCPIGLMADADESVLAGMVYNLSLIHI